MECNATLTTATYEALPFWCDERHNPAEGDFTQCKGFEHFLLHTLTCAGCVDTPVGAHQQHYSRGVMWHDGTPGATPHTPPADVCPFCGQTHDCGESHKHPISCVDCPSCGGRGETDEFDQVYEETSEILSRLTGDRPTGPKSWYMALSDSEKRAVESMRTGDRPTVTDTRSAERRHIDAVVDALATYGIPMLDRDALARRVLDAAWRKAPWTVDRPTVTDAEVEAAMVAAYNRTTDYIWVKGGQRWEQMRAALEAAAAVRQEQPRPEDDR